MDEQIIQLNMVDHIQRLGLAYHFQEEIENILENVYRYNQLSFSLKETLTSPEILNDFMKDK